MRLSLTDDQIDSVDGAALGLGNCRSSESTFSTRRCPMCADLASSAIASHHTMATSIGDIEAEGILDEFSRRKRHYWRVDKQIKKERSKERKKEKK